MELSRKISEIKSSRTLEIIKTALNMQIEGEDVIMLCAGEPDFDTPLPIKEAGIKAIRNNKTHYTANVGILELREAIKEKLKRDNKLDYSVDEIIVTSGAKQAIYNGFRGLINHGDEVLVVAPAWVSYVEQIHLARGIPILVFSEDIYKPRISEIEVKITPRTRVMIINSPNNPVGYVYSKDELIKIGELVLKYDLMLISDEIYEKIIYDDNKHYSLPAIMPELRDRTLIVNGFSKAYAMTGWRIGYAAGPKDMISYLARIQSHQTSNACSISQYAALEALTNPEVEKDVMIMRKKFEERRNIIVSELKRIPGLKFYEPEGAFYIFVDISAYLNKYVTNSLDFCHELLVKEGIAIVPGISFFKEDFVRISYAASVDDIKKGIAGFKRFLSSL